MQTYVRFFCLSAFSGKIWEKEKVHPPGFEHRKIKPYTSIELIFNCVLLLIGYSCLTN